MLWTDYNMRDIAQTWSRQHLDGLRAHTVTVGLFFFFLIPSLNKDLTDGEFKIKGPKQYSTLYRAICSYKSVSNLYMRKGLHVLH